jgi:uncharacterized integral membrane protein
MNQEERTKNNQNKWSVVFSILYVLIFVLGVMVLKEVNGELPTSISIFDLILIILASFRLTRLFVYDHIMQFFRDWFLDKEYYKDERGACQVRRFPPIVGPRRTVNDLLGCPWCFGMWAGLLVPFFYFLTPIAWFFILVLAVSGVASLIQVTSNLVGWSAEYKKRKTKSKFD